MSVKRIDDDGRWESDDNGRTWVLVEPSQTWLESVSAISELDRGPSAEERLAEAEEVLGVLLGKDVRSTRKEELIAEAAKVRENALVNSDKIKGR